MEQMKKPTAATVGFLNSDNLISQLHSIKFCGGEGQYHSNEHGCKSPRPYLEVTPLDILMSALFPQGVDKPHSLWMMSSVTKSRNFATQRESGVFHALTLDIDNNRHPEGFYGFVRWIEDRIGSPVCIAWTTKSATVDNQKLRAVILVDADMTGAEFCLYQSCLNDIATESGFDADRATERCGQLFYLPNKGAFYDCYFWHDTHYLEPKVLFADRILQKQKEVAQANAEAETRRNASLERLERFKSSGATSAIAAFNLSHTVEDVLLAAGYERKGQDFRHPKSESGSYSCNVKDGVAYSLSPSDPLSGRARDAFGCYAILNHGGDVTAAAKAVYATMREAA